MLGIWACRFPARLLSFSILVRIDLLLGRLPSAQPACGLAFQYPRADRLIVGGASMILLLVAVGVSVSSCGSTYCWGSRWLEDRVRLNCFSILVRIDLLLGPWSRQRSVRLSAVSVSSCGSTYCWGCGSRGQPRGFRGFSILVRIDLLLGCQHCPDGHLSLVFQYPRADRLIVGVQSIPAGAAGYCVSVSSCGSTYCWGRGQGSDRYVFQLFQYPRADRLIVGAVAVAVAVPVAVGFQYPRADRLIVGGKMGITTALIRSSFSILVRIDLLLGDFSSLVEAAELGVSVSSCGSTYCWGYGDISGGARTGRFSILVRIDLLLGIALNNQIGRL